MRNIDVEPEMFLLWITENIPREYLAKILKELTQKGFLNSVKGIHGGYRLARPRSEMTFLDIIEAIEGPIHINLCTEGDRCSCKQVGTCTMHDFWIDQEAHFKKALARHSFGKYKKAKA